MGSMVLPSKVNSLSKTAFLSLYNVFQNFNALSQLLFFGENSLFFKKVNVFSSGAIIPPLAPISILILQTVILPSMVIFSNTSPAYSTKYPVAPEVVNSEIIYNATSFGLTPFSRVPLMEILIFLGFICMIH